jgi:hypothetical protein
MLDRFRCVPALIRGLALACITVLGLVTIVGSGGGGALGFPPCPPSLCDGGSVTVPAAFIQPAYITALVGTLVTYTVNTSNTTGSLIYQWRRSSDGGATYSDIVGATGSSYSLAGVNLSDDGAVFLVVVHAGNGTVQAISHLVVSATPGVVFEDGELLPANWLVSPIVDAIHPLFVHIEEHFTSGGNPGAFQKMTFQLAQGSGSARVIYTSLSSIYDPVLQGAIHVIDYAEDCIAFQSGGTTYTQSNLLIEQLGRRYVSNTPNSCVLGTWSAAASRASLVAQDFQLFDGPACSVGESCPDFSASAMPMRFGYWRVSFGVGGDSIAHGIDNWKVTVWRR